MNKIRIREIIIIRKINMANKLNTISTVKFWAVVKISGN